MFVSGDHGPTHCSSFGTGREIADTPASFALDAEIVQLWSGLAMHELGNDVGRGERPVEDVADPSADWHVDAHPLGERKHAGSRSDSLGHHVRRREDLRERATVAELLADAAVTALRATTRRGQVAVSREAEERERCATERHAEPSELGESAA